MTVPRLAARLREETHALHHVAEHSGIMRDLLRGRLDRHLYLLLLRNLHAIYAALESALNRHAESTLVAPVRFPLLFREPALREDLEHLHGSDWASLSIVDAAAAYVERLQQLSDDRPVLLTAHAYVRYMGDLSGGQLLHEIVRRSYGADSTGTAFYRFPVAVDVRTIKAQFHTALETLGVDADEERNIVDEAKSAFSRHARLFEELAAPRYTPSPP